MNRSHAVASAVAFGIAIVTALAGCSSLVSDQCVSGYQLVAGVCLQITVGSNDGGSGPDASAPDASAPDASAPDATGLDGSVADASPDAFVPDAFVCAPPTTMCGQTCVDLSDDPDDCGHCGRVCPSGVCSAGVCTGSVAGELVAIGHDYASVDDAMDRLLGNAVGLTGGSTLTIGWWQGTATSTGATAAAHAGLAAQGRASTDVVLSATFTADDLATLDAVVIEPQLGDAGQAAASGSAESSVLATFLSAGHVVVLLEGARGVTYSFAAGAGLYTVGAPIDISGTIVTVSTPGDATASGVVSPYLAKSTSTAYAGVGSGSAVVTDTAGDAVVFQASY